MKFYFYIIILFLLSSCYFGDDSNEYETRETHGCIMNIDGSDYKIVSRNFLEDTRIMFYPDNQHILAGFYDGLYRYDLQGNEEKISDYNVNNFDVISSDCQRIILKTESNTYKIADLQGNIIRQITFDETKYYHNFKFSDDLKWVYFCSTKNKKSDINIIDLVSENDFIFSDTLQIPSVCYDSHNKIYFTEYKNGTLKLLCYNKIDSSLIIISDSLQYYKGFIRLSIDGNSLVYRKNETQIVCYNTVTGISKTVYNGQISDSFRIKVSKTGEYLYLLNHGLEVINMNSLQKYSLLPNNRISDFALSPDEQKIFVLENVKF